MTLKEIEIEDETYHVRTRDELTIREAMVIESASSAVVQSVRADPGEGGEESWDHTLTVLDVLIDETLTREELMDFPSTATRTVIQAFIEGSVSDGEDEV